MHVVYVDTLFLLNATIDYLLILCSARIAGEPLYRKRFACAAAFGGIYAVSLFLPGLGFLYHPLCRMAAAVLMVLIAFYKSQRLFRQLLIFFALSCAFGGGVVALSLLGGNELSFGIESGVFYSVVDMKIVLVSASVCYFSLTLIFRRYGRHSVRRGELEPVTLHFYGKKITLTALRDTGNTLTDPISGYPAIVVEYGAITELFPPGDGPDKEDAIHPTQALERLNLRWPGRFRLLPYRSVGVEQGLLLAIRLDEVQIGECVQPGTLAALSPGPVSDTGTYQVLAGVP